MERLNDEQFRKILLKELYETYGDRSDTRIVNEMGIDKGQSRVDVAVINGIMHGYEIKSDLDTLDRLPRQMEYYNRAFERMTIVVSRNYVDDVKKLIPNWWGIKIMSSDQTRLINIRKGRKVSMQDPDLIINLLWKSELETMIDYLELPKSLKKQRKNQLLNLIMRETDFSTLKSYVYDTLKTRTDWRSENLSLY